MTESIPSTQNSHFIDNSLFQTDSEATYELKIISFSRYSKSLPSTHLRFKYTPDTVEIFNLKNNQVNAFSTNTHNKEATLNSFEYKRLSQLDLILILIFLTLLLVLVISSMACCACRRQARKNKEMKQSINKDFDDWGFQSSAATATFLSSASSSEKSFNIFNKYSSKKS